MERLACNGAAFESFFLLLDSLTEGHGCAGTKREKYLAENVKAFDVSRQLSKEDLAEIEAAFPHTEVVGERYGEAHMKVRCSFSGTHFGE